MRKRHRGAPDGHPTSAAREQSQSDGRGKAIQVTVAVRQQTVSEQHLFSAALELLLVEMVRQEIAKRKDG